LNFLAVSSSASEEKIERERLSLLLH
jgi:hypothetical protein